jgi:hypothetical protein
MFYKTILISFLLTILVSCTNTDKPKLRNKSCVQRVQRLLKTKDFMSPKNILKSIHKIYNKKLYENTVHLMIEYPFGDILKTLEIKWDSKSNSFKAILPMIKNSFEESMISEAAILTPILLQIPKYKTIYKQSYYYLGLKKLYLTFNHESLSSIQLGRDFSCRLENKLVECHCAYYFR